MQRIAAILTLVGCLLVGGLAYSVQSAGAIAGTIRLSISCATNPETTTLTNNTDTTLNLAGFAFSTLVNPRQGIEPISFSGTLAPQASATISTGSNAPAGSRTQQSIYNNEAGGEGARLATPYGNLTVLCSAGSGELTVTDTTITTTPTTVTTTPTTGGTTTTTAMTTTRTTTTTRAVTTTTTAAPMPGLPNTGGGGTAGGGTPELPLVTLAVLATLVGGGALAARRR